MVSVSALRAASLVTSFKGNLEMGAPEYPAASGAVCSGTKPLTESAIAYWFLSLCKKAFFIPENGEALERVFQFAYVSRPLVAMHLLLRFHR